MTHSPYLAQLIKTNDGEDLFGAGYSASIREAVPWAPYAKRVQTKILRHPFHRHFRRGKSDSEKLARYELEVARIGRKLWNKNRTGAADTNKRELLTAVSNVTLQARILGAQLQSAGKTEGDITKKWNTFTLKTVPSLPSWSKSTNEISGIGWAGTAGYDLAKFAKTTSNLLVQFRADIGMALQSELKDWGNQMKKEKARRRHARDDASAAAVKKAGDDILNAALAKKKARHDMKNIGLEQTRTPFNGKTEGNIFRKWVRAKDLAFAKKIDLSKSGAHNNSYMRKAWAKYGLEFMRSPEGEAIYQRLKGGGTKAPSDPWAAHTPEPKKRKSRRRSRSSTPSYSPPPPPLPMADLSMVESGDKMAKFTTLAKKYWWVPVSAIGVLGTVFVIGSLNKDSDPAYTYISGI